MSKLEDVYKHFMKQSLGDEDSVRLYKRAKAKLLAGIQCADDVIEAARQSTTPICLCEDCVRIREALRKYDEETTEYATLSEGRE